MCVHQGVRNVNFSEKIMVGANLAILHSTENTGNLIDRLITM